MPTKLQKNTFQGGMDKGKDPKQIEPSKYEEGYNVSISQDGREDQLSTFKGIEVLDTIQASIADRTVMHLLGSWEAEYLLDGDETLMLLAFIYDETNMKVYAIEQDGTTRLQYTQAVSATDYNFAVDCEIHQEAGTSYAYFTDGYNELKKLPLVITTAGKGDTTPYEEEEILLVRGGVRGGITGIDVGYGNGGDLLCGTYQFAVRLLNNSSNKYTKWSLLTNPVFIGMEHSTTEENHGGIGYVSDGDIELTLTWEQDYLTDGLFNYFQIAVIENVEGVEQLIVKALQPVELSTDSDTYRYTTNKKAKQILTIDDVTVDDAAIKTGKTLVIKNNKLVIGNTEYHPLDYDNGDPIIAATTAPKLKVFTNEKAVAYRNPDNATNYKGHFRDELYRYGVVYEDKYGNYSKPKIIDFAGATANEAAYTAWATTTAYVVDDRVSTGGYGYICLENHTSGTFATDLAAGKWKKAPADFRFPARTDGLYGTLLNASSDIQALGLDIKGLDNHPSWAVAMHIVRVPRKKKIQFQTPLVPSIFVQPAKAVGSYPDQRYSAEEANLEVLNVEAANPDGTFIPKNFFHILPKNMVRFGDLYEATDVNGGLYVTHANTTISRYYASSTGTLSSDVYSGANEQLLYSVQVSALSLTIWENYDYYLDPYTGEEYETYSGWYATDVGVFTLKRRDKTSSGAFSTFGIAAVDVSTLGSNQPMTIGTGGDMNTTLDLTTYDYLLEFTDS